MKRRDAVPAAISADRLNWRRKAEVPQLVHDRPSKLEAHVRPTFDRETGLPDGGTTSALAAGWCVRCGLSRDAILETRDGDRCDAKRGAWAKPSVGA